MLSSIKCNFDFSFFFSSFSKLMFLFLEVFTQNASTFTHMFDIHAKFYTSNEYLNIKCKNIREKRRNRYAKVFNKIHCAEQKTLLFG